MFCRLRVNYSTTAQQACTFSSGRICFQLAALCQTYKSNKILCILSIKLAIEHLQRPEGFPPYHSRRTLDESQLSNKNVGLAPRQTAHSVPKPTRRPEISITKHVKCGVVVHDTPFTCCLPFFFFPSTPVHFAQFAWRTQFLN